MRHFFTASALALAAGATVLALPAAAQSSTPAAPADAPATQSAPAAGQMTPDQIKAFNAAVTDFTAGQTAQQSGDNAAAVAKYDAALPAIRTAVQVQPDTIDNVNFLANALYANAAANGALGNMDKVIALYTEAAPHWQVVAAKPADAASRTIFAGILVQMANSKLAAQDKAGADPLYQEALPLARKSVAEKAGDPIARNLLLSALLGASQTSADPALKQEAVTMSKAMIADGSVDAANKPAAQAMAGAAPAAPAAS